MIYASFGLRLLAFILDIIVVVAIETLVFWLIPNDHFVSRHIIPNFGSVDSAISAGILWLYFIVLTKRFGATIGKRALGLRVVMSDGQPVDWFTIMVREMAGKIFSTLPLGLGFWWVSWDTRKQALHDKIASTVVIKE